MVSPAGTDVRARRHRTMILLAVAALVAVLAVPAGAFAAPSAPAGRAATTPAATTALAHALGVGHPPTLAAPTTHASAPSSAALVRGAIDSLALGAGPAHGLNEACVATSSVAAHCALPAPAHRPALPHPGVAAEGWHNATFGSSFFFGGPGAGYGASMAYDAYDGYLVYYGGCSVVCPTNETWVYDYGAWFNLTNYANAPPAVYDASMTFDPTVNYVVLFGGCGATLCPMNETWEFQSGNWYNVSAPFCFIGCLWAPSPREGASMVFANDSADNITVLFGGCTTIFCFSTSNETWEWYGVLGAWIPISTSTAPSARGFAAATSIPGSGVLLFGGCTGAYGTCLNDTWIFENSTWVNETTYLQVFGFANPPARAEAQLEYDTSLGIAILSGGGNDVAYLNDSWAWECPFFCGWYNLTGAGNLPAPLFLGASPSESGPYPPLIQGGVCECAPGSYLNSASTWIYEPAVSATTSILPQVGPARSAVTFNATLSGGTPGYIGFWVFGDGGFLGSPNGTHNFTLPGTYFAVLWAWDFWGASVNVATTVTIETFATTAVATPATTDVGTPVAFSTTAPVGGSAPYNYSWEFGDASTGYGASPVHTYAAAGTYVVNLTLTDAHGLETNASVNVAIVAGPSVTFTASATTVDAGMSVSFTPTPSGGVSPYSYAWSFGDGGTSTASAPSHAYAAAGSYTVNVTATDAIGGTATHSLAVTVNPALSAAATVSKSSVATGTSVWFNATASGGTPTYTYSWVFGDAGHAATASASHAFTTAGTYTATVWVNDSVGQSVVKTVSVTVTSTGGGGGGTTSTGSSLPSWIWYAVIGVIVLAVIVAAVLMMMRRKKPSATMAPSPPAGAAGSDAAGGGPSSPPSGSS